MENKIADSYIITFLKAEDRVYMNLFKKEKL